MRCGLLWVLSGSGVDAVDGHESILAVGAVPLLFTAELNTHACDLPELIGSTLGTFLFQRQAHECHYADVPIVTFWSAAMCR